MLTSTFVDRDIPQGCVAIRSRGRREKVCTLPLASFLTKKKKKSTKFIRYGTTTDNECAPQVDVVTHDQRESGQSE